jgi:hypothetical protein
VIGRGGGGWRETIWDDNSDLLPKYLTQNWHSSQKVWVDLIGDLANLSLPCWHCYEIDFTISVYYIKSCSLMIIIVYVIMCDAFRKSHLGTGVQPTAVEITRQEILI